MNKMDFSKFQWLNQAAHRIEGDTLVMTAPPISDFFCGSGITLGAGNMPTTLCNAPFFYTDVAGDFVFRAKVSLPFKDTYDSATLMVMQAEDVWAKICFEKTDFNTIAVVSVVTNGISDDANGCNITQEEVWLQMVRSGNGFGLHYSLDGERFDMIRFFSLPVDETVKVGFVAQAPTGDGGERYFKNPTLEHRTVQNIRAGR